MGGKFDYHDAKPASRDLSEDIAAALREAGSMTRAELREELGENAETISRNLRSMMGAGLIWCEERQFGEVIYYMRDGQ